MNRSESERGTGCAGEVRTIEAPLIAQGWKAKGPDGEICGGGFHDCEVMGRSDDERCRSGERQAVGVSSGDGHYIGQADWGLALPGRIAAPANDSAISLDCQRMVIAASDS